MTKVRFLLSVDDLTGIGFVPIPDTGLDLIHMHEKDQRSFQIQLEIRSICSSTSVPQTARDRSTSTSGLRSRRLRLIEADSIARNLDSS